MSSVPWVEFYRPSHIDDVVLNPLNKIIFKNIIDSKYFPHLLLYGPPGVGKTTLVLNLINAYQDKHGTRDKGLVMMMNASDDRGIDIIRNQINQFVNSKSLFNNGMKFVILDEVDYMTKNAQQALRYLLQKYSGTVRFCLICNYISRIDEGLQNEFLRLRFNQLPETEIIKFLTNIAVCEKLNMSEKSISLIQKLYRSDIRSMINFMQSNQNVIDTEFNIIDSVVWENLFLKFVQGEKLDTMSQYIQEISNNYNIDKKNIIKDYLNYIIRNKPEIITHTFLEFMENIMHSQDCKNGYYINYAISRISVFLDSKES